MSEKQLEALMSWIKATIDVKIEEAFGRDSLHEDIIEIECKKDLYVALGLREEEE
jgi:hypothetical protein